MDVDKFERMRNASLNDEDLIVKTLTGLGMLAHKNRNVALQRKHGDVIFTTTDGLKRSIESQVSKKHPRFSYSAHKVDEYVGVGKYDHAYTMLGCRSSYQSHDMFYIVVQAPRLHEMISSDRDHFLSNDGKYFIISPGEFQDLPGLVVVGETVEKVFQKFANELSKYG